MLERGFSLIEILFVIAIMGILALVAVPNYQAYTIRAKVSDVISAATGMQLGVTEELLLGAPLESIQTSSLPVSPPAHRFVDEITVEQGVIKVTANTKKIGLSNEPKFQVHFTPRLTQGGIQWQCHIDPEHLNQYAPQVCRQAN